MCVWVWVWVWGCVCVDLHDVIKCLVCMCGHVERGSVAQHFCHTHTHTQHRNLSCDA